MRPSSSDERNSTMGIFDHIFIDIGDEQSIENDLRYIQLSPVQYEVFIKNSNEKTLI